MKKIIAFNWKMNPASLKEAKKLLSLILKAKSLKLKANLIIFPPFIFLGQLSKTLTPKTSNLKPILGSQDVFWENPPAGGAYTGEISPKMLKNLGVEYVIVGHSERRNYLGETDEMITKKIKAAVQNKLIPILCVGEPKRELGIKNNELRMAKNYIKNQLEKDLKFLKPKTYNLKPSLIIAYEPIWAIGTGNYCEPADALEIIKFIKNFLNSKFYILNPKVLYGGSVNSKNIKDYLKYNEIDGVLVGGASVNQKELKKILNII